jgi:hypothetical protein
MEIPDIDEQLATVPTRADIRPPAEGRGNTLLGDPDLSSQAGDWQPELVRIVNRGPPSSTRSTRSTQISQCLTGAQTGAELPAWFWGKKGPIPRSRCGLLRRQMCGEVCGDCLRVRRGEVSGQRCTGRHSPSPLPSHPDAARSVARLEVEDEVIESEARAHRAGPGGKPAAVSPPPPAPRRRFARVVHARTFTGRGAPRRFRRAKRSSFIATGIPTCS